MELYSSMYIPSSSLSYLSRGDLFCGGGGGAAAGGAGGAAGRRGATLPPLLLDELLLEASLPSLPSSLESLLDQSSEMVLTAEQTHRIII